MRLTKIQGHKQPLLWYPPHLTMYSHPRGAIALLLPTSNWQTPDPHCCFIFSAHRATWDPLICVWKQRPCCLHLLRKLPGAPPFLRFPCVPPYSVSVAAEKKSKKLTLAWTGTKRRPESFLVPLSFANPAQQPISIVSETILSHFRVIAM
jgi:hypothetical protein